MQVKLANDLVVKKPVELNVQARDTVPLALDLEVPPEATWSGAQLGLDENDKEPASIALDGPVTETSFPQTLAVANEVNVKEPNLNYKVTKAVLDLDGPGVRAAKGKRFVLLTVIASNKDSKFDAYVGPESFRITADGTSIAAMQITPAAEAVKALNSQEFRVAFVIPQSAKSATLVLGEANKDTGNIPLAFK